MVMTKQEVFAQIKGGLIVSCQALPEEPLHSSYIMSRMAYSAMLGGACAIRANSVADITEIKKLVPLPVIGIIKTVYDDSPVYITSTPQDVRALAACGVDIIAMDATDRPHHGGKTLEDIFPALRQEFGDMIFMADCSCFEDGIRAQKLGFDCVGTTLSGYTQATQGTALPNFPLMERFARELDIPVIAEGGIWSPAELKQAFQCGVHAAVVGTAITRPREITRRFADALK